MDNTDDLAELGRSVSLLSGEISHEGWAAHRRSDRGDLLGLVMLSNWRVMFVDVRDGFSAMPIAKIDSLQIASPRRLVLSTWYDRLDMSFASHGHCGSLLNRLRQDPSWNAMEFRKQDYRPDVAEPSGWTPGRSLALPSGRPKARCAAPSDSAPPALLKHPAQIRA